MPREVKAMIIHGHQYMGSIPYIENKVDCQNPNHDHLRPYAKNKRYYQKGDGAKLFPSPQTSCLWLKINIFKKQEFS